MFWPIGSLTIVCLNRKMCKVDLDRTALDSCS